MTFFSRGILYLSAALAVIAAGEPPVAPPGDQTVAQRGDLRLTRAGLEEALSSLDPAVRAQVTATPQALATFARDRVLNQAVLAEAKASGWDTKPDIVRRAAEAHDAVVVQTYLASKVSADPLYPSEAEITEAYQANKSRLVTPKQYRVAQIVLVVKQGATPAEEEEIRKKAADLRAQAIRPNADFADLARKNSQDPAGVQNGGEVGWLRESEMLQAARAAVSGLSDGGVSSPVRMPDGWHVIKLLETRPAATAQLSDAKPQIVQALRQTRVQKIIRGYLDEIVKAQPIQLNEIEMAKGVTPAK